jgi:hypothetical protein
VKKAADDAFEAVLGGEQYEAEALAAAAEVVGKESAADLISRMGLFSAAIESGFLEIVPSHPGN